PATTPFSCIAYRFRSFTCDICRFLAVDSILSLHILRQECHAAGYIFRNSLQRIVILTQPAWQRWRWVRKSTSFSIRPEIGIQSVVVWPAVANEILRAILLETLRLRSIQAMCLFPLEPAIDSVTDKEINLGQIVAEFAR